MQEVLPGVFHWTASHPQIHVEVSSCRLDDGGVLVDPLVPADVGLPWFAERAMAPTAVLLPVDVLKTQGSDLAPAQPKPDQQSQDREVSPSDRGAPVAARQQTARLASLKRPRQPRQPPVSDPKARLHPWRMRARDPVAPGTRTSYRALA